MATKTPLAEADVEAALAALPGWARDGQAIARTWRRRDFKEALAFVAAIGWLAEREDHHPDLDVRYAAVTVRLWSHDAGGVTARDLRLARLIDALDTRGT